MPPEQEDRLMEHRRTVRGDLTRPPSALDERDQPARCLAALLHRRPAQVRHARYQRDTERIASVKLDRDSGPPMQQCALRCVRRCASRTMPVEPLQIEGSCAEPQDPALDHVPDNAATPRDADQGHPVGKCRTDRIENDLDARDLSRQRIPGQHALAVPARTALRQRHRQHDKCVTCLEPALDPTASKPEIVSIAASTTTTSEDDIASIIDDRGVVAIVDIEYENHVLATAPG
jgi:hypothetical protein